jgi:hypothetical protein
MRADAEPMGFDPDAKGPRMIRGLDEKNDVSTRRTGDREALERARSSRLDTGVLISQEISGTATSAWERRQALFTAGV